MPQAPDVSRVQREIGRRVRAARLRAGLTQEMAAANAGIDYKRWQRIELGETNCTIRSLVRVAEAVETTFWTLLGARG
ncbi:MAG: helix-turn-helix domain-containing protein [Deltaproteobacteria bacterium]|nr:helix-turn-helix domain-containing protein [Kofleriaceae bacterium]